MQRIYPLLSLFSLLLGCSGLLGPPPRDNTLMVLMTARTLPAGTTIQADDLFAMEVELRYVPKGVSLSPDLLVGERTHMRVVENSFVRREHIANPAFPSSMADLVPEGMRSVDLPRAQLHRPSDRVDVWWTPPGGEPCAIRQLALVIGSGDAPLKRVQVLATPAEALTMARAAQSRTLRFKGRDDLDTKPHPEDACTP